MIVSNFLGVIVSLSKIVGATWLWLGDFSNLSLLRSELFFGLKSWLANSLIKRSCWTAVRCFYSSVIWSLFVWRVRRFSISKIALLSWSIFAFKRIFESCSKRELLVRTETASSLCILKSLWCSILGFVGVVSTVLSTDFLHPLHA